MRISDWSSDVCSSDLALDVTCRRSSMSGPRRAFHVGSPAVIASAAKTQCRRAAGGGSPGPMPDKPFDPNTVSLDEMRALFREFPGPELEAGTQAEIGRASGRERLWQDV